QVLAFASDTTRVFSFKLGRDASNRVYPDSGFKGAFHSASHHGEREERIMDFQKINNYHVSMVPYLLEKLKATPDGPGGPGGGESTAPLDLNVIQTAPTPTADAPKG